MCVGEYCLFVWLLLCTYVLAYSYRASVQLVVYTAISYPLIKVSNFNLYESLESIKFSEWGNVHRKVGNKSVSFHEWFLGDATHPYQLEESLPYLGIGLRGSLLAKLKEKWIVISFLSFAPIFIAFAKHALDYEGIGTHMTIPVQSFF